MQTELDNKDITICNHCECDKRLDCKRYRPDILSLYDFEAISTSFDCFIKKD